jgi:2-oxoglutarate dehydrogenase E2 component (dihydrolipoamide succinyltransferase)
MPEVKVPELAESPLSTLSPTFFNHSAMVPSVIDSANSGTLTSGILETDKVNVEVVSEEAGVLSEQLANEGDTVEVGQAIAVVVFISFIITLWSLII